MVMESNTNKMKERLSGTENVSIQELCEVRWQSAVMYAQKSYRARSEKKTSFAEHFKMLSLGMASKVWYAMGFTENEVTEHRVIFTNTILSKGGTCSSVAEYFKVINETNKVYPRADQETATPSN